MAKKKIGELPSGNIRVRVYDGTDENGRKIYRSFTGKTKSEANALAAEWKHNRKEIQAKLTVSNACERYIELKRSVLSPSTIKGYGFAAKKIAAHRIGEIDISQLKDADVQLFISDIAAESSPKTVANVYGFMTAAVSVFAPKLTFNVTLPKKTKPMLYTPSTADVQVLLDHCDTTELKLAVLFAAVGTMRRGEACAVTFDDVDYDDCTISINKSFVETDDYLWELKAPKTYDSIRTVSMPPYVMDMIRSLGRTDGYILNCTPDRLYVRFKRALKLAGLPDFRYHDLRHHAASQMHAAGVPDRYIEAIGGWKPGSNVLKRTYENVIDIERKRVQESYLKQHRFSV